MFKTAGGQASSRWVLLFALVVLGAVVVSGVVVGVRSMSSEKDSAASADEYVKEGDLRIWFDGKEVPAKHVEAVRSNLKIENFMADNRREEDALTAGKLLFGLAAEADARQSGDLPTDEILLELSTSMAALGSPDEIEKLLEITPTTTMWLTHTPADEIGTSADQFGKEDPEHKPAPPITSSPDVAKARLADPGQRAVLESIYFEQRLGLELANRTDGDMTLYPTVLTEWLRSAANRHGYSAKDSSGSISDEEMGAAMIAAWQQW